MSRLSKDSVSLPKSCPNRGQTTVEIGMNGEKPAKRWMVKVELTDKKYGTDE